ncbi:MAG: hypothetical protein KBT75_05100 [Oleispira antarctica]|uniref:Uncharacterized protein n=1 Tax=Oleispira antarctica RB-8 TaxID=698738 RepID=R4YM81_OLEAN|nr:hypothetical protein [Oleispira antarctica]MBQ0794077.1 hypothetical protein [Oleispira antarctica]CCK76006.1 hypothetical protein OLEAN_C18300 [Oleispira antarctica RB-8]
MRLVLLLITALLIGFLLEKQLNARSSDSNTKPYSGITEEGVAPSPPKSQQDIKKLREDLNNLMLDTTDKEEKILNSL